MNALPREIKLMKAVAERLKEWHQERGALPAGETSAYWHVQRLADRDMRQILTWLAYDKPELAFLVRRDYEALLREAEAADDGSGSVRICVKPLANILADRLMHIVGLGFAPPLELNDSESEIIRALGDAVMTGEVIARKLRRRYNSTFKALLAGMRKRGILGNRSRKGYFLESTHKNLLSKPGQGPD